MNEKELLTVIVPCLNEEANIASTVADINSYQASLPMPLELLLVDDGSTDGTRREMEALCARFPNVRMQVNPRNLGIGRSVMNAYDVCRAGSWITVMPGDNEFHFASIRNYLAIRHDHDLIVGYLQNSVIRPLHRRLASWAFSTTVRTVYGLPYRYLNGMKLYRVEVFKGIQVSSSGYAYNAELLAKAILRNPFLRIAEVPFVARGRLGGNTKAFKPKAVTRAVWEFSRGRHAVSRYRREVLGITE